MSNPLPEVSTVDKIPQPHGGALNRGGTVGNRGHILRKRKQHVAWLALQEITRRLKENPGEMLDKNLIAAAQLDKADTLRLDVSDDVAHLLRELRDARTRVALPLPPGDPDV